MIQTNDFTRVNNDINGNPRFVCHFLQFTTNNDLADYMGMDKISRKYDLALKRAKPLGGRRFHNKQYGGGIVFGSIYNLADLCADINSLMGALENA